jgi:thiol:disulfide interchange protein
MKASLAVIIVAGCLGVTAITLTPQSFAAGIPGQDAPIYDESANATQQISDAVAVAAQEHKHVLLQFGANWCIWCHRLHDTCATDPQVAAMLKQHYVVVLVDVNKGHNQDLVDKYGNPTRLGLPVLVVLDETGKQLTTEDSGKLEEGDHHSPAKILAFLQADS